MFDIEQMPGGGIGGDPPDRVAVRSGPPRPNPAGVVGVNLRGSPEHGADGGYGADTARAASAAPG